MSHDLTPLPPSIETPDPPDWLPDPTLAGDEHLVRALQAAGHQAYFVGGAVRNWLLRLPVEDIDIATSAEPDEVARLFDAVKSVGAHFGVMLVKQDGHTFEVATFRAEGSYIDHRRPAEVRYGTLEEDYQRRDFTVNAMYYDPVARHLIDPAGGRRDLESRTLRTVGDPHRRFEEDALRLLRAIRFAVRYELEIEPNTAVAIRVFAPTLGQISAERIADELLRTLAGPHPGRAMHLLRELGLWPYVMPEVEPMHGCQQPPNFHPEGDVFIHTAMVLDRIREAWAGAPPEELVLAGLLHDVGKPPTFVIEDRIRFPEHQRVGTVMADEICRRLRLSSHRRERVVELVANHMRFTDVKRMKLSTLRRFLGLPDFKLHLVLHWADCMSSHRNLDNYHFCVEQFKELAAEECQGTLLPPPLVGGADLIALGLKPGPVFKELLDATREEQLEGRLPDRAAALEFLRARVREKAVRE